MHSTDVTFRINMGFHEALLGMDEAQQNFEELEKHMGDILPTLDDVDDLDDAEHIKGITLKTLEIGTFGGAYNIQFTVTIQHDVPLSLLQPTTIQDITDVIYEHGANSPITFEEVPNYFLYPYESSSSSSSIERGE
jgi:hypothetical protein